jgi:hypothetical protein
MAVSSQGQGCVRLLFSSILFELVNKPPDAWHYVFSRILVCGECISYKKKSKLEAFCAPENASVDVQHLCIYVLKNCLHNYHELKDFHIKNFSDCQNCLFCMIFIHSLFLLHPSHLPLTGSKNTCCGIFIPPVTPDVPGL